MDRRQSREHIWEKSFNDGIWVRNNEQSTVEKHLRTRQAVSELDLGQRFQSRGRTDVTCVRLWMRFSFVLPPKTRSLLVLQTCLLRSTVISERNNMLFQWEQGRKDVGSVDVALRVDVPRNHLVSIHGFIVTLIDVHILGRDRFLLNHLRALLGWRPINSLKTLRLLLSDVVQQLWRLSSFCLGRVRLNPLSSWILYHDRTSMIWHGFTSFVDNFVIDCNQFIKFRCSRCWISRSPSARSSRNLDSLADIAILIFFTTFRIWVMRNICGCRQFCDLEVLCEVLQSFGNFLSSQFSATPLPHSCPQKCPRTFA